MRAQAPGLRAGGCVVPGTWGREGRESAHRVDLEVLRDRSEIGDDLGGEDHGPLGAGVRDADLARLWADVPGSSASDLGGGGLSTDFLTAP